MKYLYGASVQGIQEFIFKTNKLQEIVGASEIVKNINTKFQEKFGNNNKVEILLNAAGNIKAIFSDESLLKEFILDFSKEIQKEAYGITISQAIQRIENDDIQTNINELEKKLKIQRNRPLIPLDRSLNITKLAPSTAKPAVKKEKGNLIDKATLQKLEAYKNIKNKKNTDLNQISNGKNKIAVIHIDGNGLGQLIPRLKKEFDMELSNFSKKLDKSTKNAFEKAKGDKELREVILGGDDVTCICNANDALEFVKEFLGEFEKETSKIFKDKFKLTACAGIAFCNKKYPFHYAVDLAEELCSQTKKVAKKIDKNLAPSSLMFHNIQSASFQSWDKFVEDELTIQNDKRDIRCDFGPYFLDEIQDYPQIQDFLYLTNNLTSKDAPTSNLRKWLSELYKSDTNAQKLLERIEKISSQRNEKTVISLNNILKRLNENLSLTNLIVDDTTPIYDALQILSITDNQKGETK